MSCKESADSVVLFCHLNGNYCRVIESHLFWMKEVCENIFLPTSQLSFCDEENEISLFHVLILPDEDEEPSK